MVKKIVWSQLMVFLSTGEARDSVMERSRPTFVQVKADGSFEMKDVPAGTYQVVIGSSNNGLRDYITKSVNVAGKDVSDSGFGASGSTYTLDIVISSKGAIIDGMVLDSKDHPVPYATVVCIPSAEHRKRPDLFQQDTADDHGRFSLRGLNPGEYTVLAWEDLEDDFRDPEFLKTNEVHGQVVRASEGDRKTVSLKVTPSSSEEQ